MKNYNDIIGKIDEAKAFIEAVLFSLDRAHMSGYCHQSLCPEMIFDEFEKWRIKINGFEIKKLDRSAEKYASPEQLCGSYADARSNIYSVGVMFYELLTGTTDISVPAAKRNKNITKELDDIIMRALLPDKNMRYQSVWQVLRDLRTI